MPTATQRPRRHGDQTFRKNDVMRLIKVAKREGLSNYRIDIFKRDGQRAALSLVVDEAAPATEPGHTPELDGWLSKHAG